ncbi:hypothetical protein [Methylobacterium platani]|uniref:Uncharacterized protein n=2 Tax=Methylobacterium platani TaxID=427683 RepID=A0A179SGJ8_9HYPH|nr:hypothetical protein [Methylobacterium platani]KMO20712.1 hypothetical protein SQ03_05040 [Methylobacterium platani JCM 14648]OAS25986.1 hypothetical protein A5481_07430 [Methylobacterium platani]
MIGLDDHAEPHGAVTGPDRDVLTAEREAHRLAAVDLLRGLQAACDRFAAALPPPTAERGGQSLEAQAAMLAAMEDFNRADTAARTVLASYGALLDVQGVA